MIISHKHKFIFIHIPKCAGSSVDHILMSLMGLNWPKQWAEVPTDEALILRVAKQYGNSECLEQHDTIREVEDYFDKMNWDISQYFKFCFLRNPWARRVSQYAYGLKMTEITGAQWAKEISEMTFDEFISKRNDSQLNWVKNKSGEIAVDFIGNTSNFQDSLDVIFDRINFPRSDSGHVRVNKTKHKDYTEYYNKETIELIAKNCHEDIKYFDYKFGE